MATEKEQQEAGMTEDEKIIFSAMDFFRTCEDAIGNNRSEAIEDIKFAAGEQWTATIQQSRQLEARPTLTLNKLEPFIRQVTNNQRQQRPRIKVHPINDQADKRIADVLAGICRHIEVNSNADDAYDIAYDYAVRAGWGYWRIVHDYIDEKSFDQELLIKPITNPFSVYFDPHSKALDGSDAKCVLITELMDKNEFEKEYPNVEIENWTNAAGDTNADWVTKDQVRIAEFFYTEQTAAELLQLEDGTAMWEDDYKKLKLDLEIITSRQSARNVIRWCKLTASAVLEKKIWIGKYIPVIPVYGQQLYIDGKIQRLGLVRNAKDAQRMYNYWMSAMTEYIALAPKSPWLIANGQDAGFENEWAQANLKNQSVLRFNQRDEDGNPIEFVPQRIPPAPVPEGLMASAQVVSADLQAIVGVFDATQQETGNQSGKALLGQQAQMDMNNFHFYDNLTKSIRFTGIQLLDLIPKIYDEERVMRIIGADGTPNLVAVNQMQEETGKVLNDLSIGRYDVEMDTGPAFNTRRLEFVNSMMPLLQDNPALFELAGDLFFRNLDFPSSEVIADRLAANNPLSEIDQNSDIDPKVQMAIKKLQMELQQAGEQIKGYEALIKQRQDIEQVRQDNENMRKEADLASKAHDRQSRHEVDLSTAEMSATAAQNVAEINATASLLSKGIDTRHLEMQIAQKDQEQQTEFNRAEKDIHEGENPFLKMSDEDLINIIKESRKNAPPQ